MTHLEAINTVLLRKGYPKQAIDQFTQERTETGTLPKDSDKEIEPGKEEEAIAEYTKQFERDLLDRMGGNSQSN